MAETLPPPMAVDVLPPAEEPQEIREEKSEIIEPEGPKPTETIYIQNLNERIRVDSMSRLENVLVH